MLASANGQETHTRKYVRKFLEGTKHRKIETMGTCTKGQTHEVPEVDKFTETEVD